MIVTLPPIPARTPSKNELKASPGRHAWVRDRKITRDWFLLIPEARPFQRPPPKPQGARVVRIDVYLPAGERRFDKLNFYAGLNPILDVLVARGYLRNDSIRWCPDVTGDEHLNGVSGHTPLTIIRITDLSDLTTPKTAA